jgi:hypothetical protein
MFIHPQLKVCALTRRRSVIQAVSDIQTSSQSHSNDLHISAADPVGVCPVRPIDRFIGQLVAKGVKAKFSDYSMLRAGVDQYSKMTTQDLIQLSEEPLVCAVQSRFKDEILQGKVLRWFFRGLPLEMAFRKVSVDVKIFGSA